MNQILELCLPLALALIMWVIGLGLTPADFVRIGRRPRVILLGLLSQVVMLPLLAWGLIALLHLPAEIGLGLMLIAASPGGASAGLLTRLAGGEVALSVSLTACTSLCALVSVPLVIGLSPEHFALAAGPAALPVADVARGLFLMATLPVACGMVLRHFCPQFVSRHELWATRGATLLFVLVVLATFVKQRDTLVQALPQLWPAILALCLAAAIGGFLLAYLGGCGRAASIAVAMETCLQNAAMAIYLALQVLHAPALAAPAVVYAFLMNVVALAAVFWFRRRSRRLVPA